MPIEIMVFGDLLTRRDTWLAEADCDCIAGTMRIVINTYGMQTSLPSTAVDIEATGVRTTVPGPAGFRDLCNVELGAQREDGE